MVQMNDDFYVRTDQSGLLTNLDSHALAQEMLTPKTTVELLEACKAGRPPPMTKWGSLPMNGQLSSEGPMGKTSLFEISGPENKFRSDGLKGEVDPASVKAHMGY